MNTVVSRLLDVDRQARQILDEAKQYYERTHEEISRERERIREQYTERAEMHIADVRGSETAAVDDAVTKANQESAEKIKRMEDIYDSEHEKWEQYLFEQCVKRVSAGD
ncbi:MAG: hypothetical protein LBV27_00115 [Oscillospiraceae bacterium]|jgi:F0F1-type ATP synthase membrane subunit b/b'|nr:hypothetical protein [Oscillospiraceae bacterium]